MTRPDEVGDVTCTRKQRGTITAWTQRNMDNDHVDMRRNEWRKTKTTNAFRLEKRDLLTSHCAGSLLEATAGGTWKRGAWDPENQHPEFTACTGKGIVGPMAEKSVGFSRPGRAEGGTESGGSSPVRPEDGDSEPDVSPRAGEWSNNPHLVLSDPYSHNTLHAAPGSGGERADAVSDEFPHDGPWTTKSEYGGDGRDDARPH